LTSDESVNQRMLAGQYTYNTAHRLLSSETLCRTIPAHFRDFEIHLMKQRFVSSGTVVDLTGHL
jgi:hypothetical protein